MKVFIVFLILICVSFANNNFRDEKTDNALYEKAQKLSKNLLIVDTHIDVPYRLKNNWEDVSVRTPKGHFDYPRAVEGGLNSAFMSIFIPARYEASGGSVELADTLIDMVELIAKDHPDKFALAYTPDDVVKHFAERYFFSPTGHGKRNTY